MRSGERVEALALHGLARDRATRAGFSTDAPANGPYRVYQRRLAPNGFETLNVDRDPVGRVEVRERSPRRSS